MKGFSLGIREGSKLSSSDTFSRIFLNIVFMLTEDDGKEKQTRIYIGEFVSRKCTEALQMDILIYSVSRLKYLRYFK